MLAISFVPKFVYTSNYPSFHNKNKKKTSIFSILTPDFLFTMYSSAKLSSSLSLTSELLMPPNKCLLEEWKKKKKRSGCVGDA